MLKSVLERPEKAGLLHCALMAIRDECPPETSMYLCMLGEDNSHCDCEACWRTYLFYVANGRRGDPYAKYRKDE